MVIPCVSKEDAMLILAIINSKIASEWFVFKFDKFQRKIFPQIKVKEMKLFPFPKDLSACYRKELISCAESIYEFYKKGKITNLKKNEKRIEQILGNLFFSAIELKKAA